MYKLKLTQASVLPLLDFNLQVHLPQKQQIQLLPFLFPDFFGSLNSKLFDAWFYQHLPPLQQTSMFLTWNSLTLCQETMATPSLSLNRLSLITSAVSLNWNLHFGLRILASGLVNLILVTRPKWSLKAKGWYQASGTLMSPK